MTLSPKEIPDIADKIRTLSEQGVKGYLTIASKCGISLQELLQVETAMDLDIPMHNVQGKNIVKPDNKRGYESTPHPCFPQIRKERHVEREDNASMWWYNLGFNNGPFYNAIGWKARRKGNGGNR